MKNFVADPCSLQPAAIVIGSSVRLKRASPLCINPLHLEHLQPICVPLILMCSCSCPLCQTLTRSTYGCTQSQCIVGWCSKEQEYRSGLVWYTLLLCLAVACWPFSFA